MNKITFLLLLLILYTGMLVAQDGAYDTSFGDNGIVLTDLGGYKSGALDITQQTDGKLLVTAYMYESDDYNLYLLRYLSNGSLDSSFGDNGKVIVSTTESFGNIASYVQNNNKILISIQNNDPYFVKRYTSSGELDTSFANNGTLNPVIPEQYSGRLQVLDDGNLIVIGGFVSNSNTSSIAVQKYLPNGTIDTSFGTNGVAEVEIPYIQENPIVSRRFKIYNDGSILILGSRTSDTQATTQLIFIKILPDGSLDGSFGTNGTFFYDIATPDGGSVNTVFDIDENGKIIVAGSIGSCLRGINPFLKRFLPTGPIDTTFGDNGSANPPENWFYSNPFQLKIQGNNRILIGWNSHRCDPQNLSFFISRVYENGTIDSSFSLEENTIGLQPNSSGSFILQDNGKIVTSGTTSVPFVNDNGEVYIGRHVNDPLGIPEENITPITVFPNPSNGIFNLKSQQPINSPYTVSDINGRILLKSTFEGSENQLELSSFSTGVYFLKVSGSTIKLLKQ